MPVTAQLAFDLDPAVAGTATKEDHIQPPDAVARERIRTATDDTMFVEAGAGAGKTSALVGRILSLIDDGVPIDAIAAITFTEKAAAELRHRLRHGLAADGTNARRADALESLDHAAIGTLHAFARRLLFEFPVEAGLPPGFGVLDELESQLALNERFEDLQDELLDSAHRHLAPGLPATDFVQLCELGTFGGLRGLRKVIEDFQANWDLVEQRVERVPPDRPLLDVDDLVDRADRIAATAVPPGDRQEPVVLAVGAAGRQLRHAIAASADLGTVFGIVEHLAATTGKKANTGNKAHWVAHGGSVALDELRADEAELSTAASAWLSPWRQYRRQVVGAIAARFVLSGALDRAAAGTLEFHDLLVLARRLLASNPAVRHLLHVRYRRVLLDEFQDTDPIQLEIAVRLTAPPDGQGVDSSTLRPERGRLFVVGDPKQSIYRFRRADIAVYLAAAGQLDAEQVTLSANFRSTSAVIDWVNGVFSQVIEPKADVQPAYAPLAVARSGSRGHGTVTVLGADGHEAEDDRISADELRRRESADVAAVVATALREGWPVGDADGDGEGGALRACQPGDIAVLLPARTSLPMLEAALSALAVPYRAENSSVIYVAPEIRAVMLALSAAADTTDELALVAALRTPLYGCSDVDLYQWKLAGGRWNPFAPVPGDHDDHPVASAMTHVRSVAERIGRDGPADLLDAIIEERRVLETALAGPDARDVWRRLRYVVDQARAWTDAGGRGIRRYLRWARFQASEARASDTILPERDQRAVRIMTVHAAKGLEFPITVVAGMTTQVQRRRAMSVVWPHSTWTLAERDDVVFEAYKPIDEQMGDAERRRLLYVACTRAVDHLVVSLHRRSSETGDPGGAGTAMCSSATVLAEAGATGHGASTFVRPASVDALTNMFADPLVLPWADEAAWERERRRAIADASTRSATSATRLATRLSATGGRPSAAAAQDAGVDLASEDDRADAEIGDAGLHKEAVDLDLPPWQRGRYGTAIGRAVHAVLQDADLVAGRNIDRLAAMQCAAEGIFGFEGQVAALSRSALEAPIVRAAAGGAEHWRELFVVADVGDTVLEGYVDLLVRTTSGLVIVDYKTDRWPAGGDQVRRIARYRFQLAAYGVALGRLLDEPVVGGLLVHCLPGPPAEQIEVDDWAGAMAVVAASVSGAGESAGSCGTPRVPPVVDEPCSTANPARSQGR